LCALSPTWEIETPRSVDQVVVQAGVSSGGIAIGNVVKAVAEPDFRAAADIELDAATKFRIEV
jgi:uncharacterized protein YwlG (UPF0340 family)